MRAEPALSDPGDGGLTRVRLDLGYDGTDFSGWAMQPGLRTVQGVLTETLARVLRRSEPAPLTVAGRTDAGVHARGQVCHVDLAEPDPVYLRRRLAAALPADIRVHDVTIAPAGFDARFGALSRRYVYRLCDDAAAMDPLRRHEVVQSPRPLDVELMTAAAALLVGEHDFAAYCRRREGATTVRELQRLAPVRSGARIDVTVEADAFCHSMVRALVGALVTVGEGRRDVAWPAAVLAAGERDPGVRVMPARGLTLEEVRYPADSDLSARIAVTRAVRAASVPAS